MYKTIISLVLYEWETWSLNLREETLLRVFENKWWEEYLDLREVK